MAITALKPLGKPQAPTAAPTPVEAINVAPTKKGLTPVVTQVVQPVGEIVAPQHVPPTVEVTTTTELVERMENNLTVVEPLPVASFALGQTMGYIDQSDLHRPRLELSQSVGPLMEAGFPPGQVILAQEEALWAEGYDPIEVTFLAGRKQFVEDVPYGSDQKARYFDTPEEVKAAGLWTTWQNDEKPPVYPMLTYVAIIKKPHYAQSAQFNIEYGDDLYAMAEIRYAKTAYPEVSKILLSPNYRGKLHTAKFGYSCAREKKGKNTVTLPRVKFAGWHTPEFVEFLSGLI